jgi:23S rRNA (uracil1939-C5)-methyltransferase
VSKEGTSIVNDVTIEKWVYGGEGLARVDGKVLLVPFVLPNEKVRIEATTAVHARLIELVEASPDRIAPLCPLFTTCGGCHYQHAPYEFQLARKAEILREQLRRVGKIGYAGDIQIVSGPPYGYRNRVQTHIQDGRLGFLATGSHELVAVESECPIASPRLNQALAEMRERLGHPRFPQFVSSLELFTNETDLQVNVIEADRRVAREFFEWCNSAIVFDYPCSMGTFRVSPRSFFQVNRFLVEQLVETALAGMGGGTAVDLYAGVGLFALPMSRLFGSVTAVESGSSAIRDLEFNAARAGVSLHTEHTRVEEYLSKLDATPELVLADPPRAGLGNNVVKQLLRLAPPRITIVSCDPATLARDLAGLSDYTIEKLTLVDLFPQTFHMETVAALRRR